MTPIYAQTVRDRTPLGQVPNDPLREYLAESRCRRTLWPAHSLDERDYCPDCQEA